MFFIDLSELLVFSFFTVKDLDYTHSCDMLLNKRIEIRHCISNLIECWFDLFLKNIGTDDIPNGQSFTINTIFHGSTIPGANITIMSGLNISETKNFAVIEYDWPEDTEYKSIKVEIDIFNDINESDELNNNRTEFFKAIPYQSVSDFPYNPIDDPMVIVQITDPPRSHASDVGGKPMDQRTSNK